MQETLDRATLYASIQAAKEALARRKAMRDILARLNQARRENAERYLAIRLHREMNESLS